MSSAKLGRLGWPLVPSPKWPGEVSLSCPECGSTDVIMTGGYPVRGTGPMGRGRLGDPGGYSKNICNKCKHTAVR